MIQDADSSMGQVLRADHLFHVTLKYTRTSDVIKNTLNRLVTALEYAITEILEKKKIKGIPAIALLKADLLRRKFPKNKQIQELVRFYNKLKKIDKGQFRVKEEYRKNVAIIMDDEVINTEKLREFLDKTKEFVKFAHEF